MRIATYERPVKRPREEEHTALPYVAETMVAFPESRIENGDVPLFEIIRGPAPLIVLSVHAGRHIPAQLHDALGRPLGLSNRDDAERHISVDIGIAAVSRLLSERLCANAFLSTHSRLVVDLNRFEDEEECIPPMADGTEIPMNKALGSQGRRARLEQYFFPAHIAIRQLIEEVAAEHGEEPFVLRLHSFARRLQENPDRPRHQDMCVYNYPEFGRDIVFEAFLRALCERNPSLYIGNNEPFSARTPGFPDKERSASPVSYRHLVQRHHAKTVAVEIRQDLIASCDGQRRYAGILADALHEAIGFEMASYGAM
jgi:predicted N-formylglutamate amidohydrolase